MNVIKSSVLCGLILLLTGCIAPPFHPPGMGFAPVFYGGGGNGGYYRGGHGHGGGSGYNYQGGHHRH